MMLQCGLGWCLFVFWVCVLLKIGGEPVGCSLQLFNQLQLFKHVNSWSLLHTCWLWKWYCETRMRWNPVQSNYIIQLLCLVAGEVKCGHLMPKESRQSSLYSLPLLKVLKIICNFFQPEATKIRRIGTFGRLKQACWTSKEEVPKDPTWLNVIRVLYIVGIIWYGITPYCPCQAARSRCTHMIFCDLELTAGFYDFEDEPRILEAGCHSDPQAEA